MDLRVYPNPNRGSFVIEGTLPANQTEGKIVITDVSGRIVTQYQITGNEFRKLISLDKTSGIYIYSIISNSEITHRGKVIIK